MVHEARSELSPVALSPPKRGNGGALHAFSRSPSSCPSFNESGQSTQARPAALLG